VKCGGFQCALGGKCSEFYMGSVVSLKCSAFHSEM